MNRKFCVIAGLFLAGTIVFCISFTVCPGLFGLGRALAAPEAESGPVEVPQEQNEAAWQDQDGNWQYGDLIEAVASVRNGGTVELLSDVSLTGGITIFKSVTIASHDPGKPCVIRNTDDKQDSGRIFTIAAGELRLQNIILDGGRDEGVTAYHPLICVNRNAYLRMLDGTVLKNAENRSQSMCGGGINVRLGRVYLYDGSQITHCKARHGGGIELNSKSQHNQAFLGMAGGSIDSCEAEAGGGVYVNIGMFQMQGGRIIENHAAGEVSGGGGGIYVAVATRAARATQVALVGILNGEITNNTAESEGGGILIRGSHAQVDLLGGTLKQNTANCGGGICVSHGTLKLQGGTITDNIADLYGGGVLGTPNSVIKLMGDPKVYDNTAGDTTDRFDNLYLDGARDDGPSGRHRPSGWRVNLRRE